MRVPLPRPDISAADREFVNDTFDRLYPICRSITGEGFRASLDILGEFIPLERLSVASGTKVLDWEVPDEWVIRDGYLADPTGERIADFRRSNLSIVNYSTSVDRELTLEELEPHLHSIDSLPQATPYVTSYYRRDWGFCLPHEQRTSLPRGTYRAFIDADHFPGQLDYAHAILPGENDREILLTSYLCHPSLANNELSGPLVLALLWQRLQQWGRRRFTYRFLLNPETIGSIVYLAQYGALLNDRMDAGFVLTCLGGPNDDLSFKHTRRNDTLADQLVRHCRSESLIDLSERPFAPDSGSDERQYCSPGFNLPVGQFARAVYGEYPGYHNSLDDKNFMDIDSLVRSADQIEFFLYLYEHAGEFLNASPYGEPHLGRRDLYPNMNSFQTRENSSDALHDSRDQLRAILYLLNYSDGAHSAVEIATRLGIGLDRLIPVIHKLEDAELLAPIIAQPGRGS